MVPRQQAGIVLVVAGLAVALAGAAGLAGVFGGRSPAGSPVPSLVAAASAPTSTGSAAPASAAASASTTQPPTATAAPTAGGPSQQPNVLGLVATFVQDLVDAYHAGTLSALVPRLHAAVITRYGEAACRASLGAIPADATYAIRVRSIGPLTTWDWVSDGRTTPIPNTATVAVDVVRSGAASAAEFHFSIVDGQVRWFSDCGTPLP